MFSLHLNKNIIDVLGVIKTWTFNSITLYHYLYINFKLHSQLENKNHFCFEFQIYRRNFNKWSRTHFNYVRTSMNKWRVIIFSQARATSCQPPTKRAKCDNVNQFRSYVGNSSLLFIILNVWFDRFDFPTRNINQAMWILFSPCMHVWRIMLYEGLYLYCIMHVGRIYLNPCVQCPNII